MQLEFTGEEIEAQRGQVTCPASRGIRFPTLRPGFFFPRVLSRILISFDIAFGSHCLGYILIKHGCAAVQVNLKIYLLLLVQLQFGAMFKGKWLLDETEQREVLPNRRSAMT